MIKWFLSITLSDQIALIGVVISVVGVIFAIVQSLQAKSAAENAQEAVKKARQDINISISISEASLLLPYLDDLAKISVEEQWIRFIDINNHVRSRLAALVRHPELGTDKARIEAMLLNMQDLNARVAIANQKTSPPAKKGEIHRAVLVARDDIISILTELKGKVGVKND